MLLQISSGIFLYQPALAQELTPTPTPVPTITADFTPTPEPTAEPTAEPTLVPTAEPTIEPTIAPTAEPRSEISPEVTPTPTLTEEITPTPTVEENQSTPENEAPPQELSPPTTTPSENPPTQTVTVEPKEDAHLAAAILKDTAAASITELDLDFQAEGSATLKTDKLDYAPTDAVLITGSGFLAGKSYTIYISSSDEPAINYQDSVTADENGNLFYSYQLDGTYRPNYQVIVTNKDGKVIAQTSFTDGNPSGNLDQCSNGASSSPTSPCTWVNGNLNSNQAHYVEGQSVPYRLVMENLPTGTPITVTLGYDIKHSNKHAIDYLTQYNRLEPHTPFGHSAESINPTSGVFGIGATTTTYAIPAPSSIGSPVAGQPTTSFNALPAGEKLMTLFGGTITGISYSSQGSLTASNSESQIDITFTVSNATAVLSWGGHIGSRLDWGFDNGTPRSAGGINGSPYHMRLIDWSINNLGNQDRSLQAGAVIPPGNLTIVKDVVPNDSSVWDFLATGPDSYSHNTNDLGDGGQDVLSVAPGTYTITETTDQNYSTSVICNTGESGGASVSVDISSNEAVICTFVNTLQQVHLTLVKTVTNNNGGTAAVIDWTLSASGPTPISGVSGSGTITNIAVDSGTYTLSESGGPFGYTAGSWSCIKNGGGPVVGSSITLAPNDNAICMISNDDNAVSLILNKVVVNNNGGTALESDWTLSASGPTPISGLGGTGSADVISGPTFSAGTYILSESAGPSGYSASSWVCTGTGSQNGNQITLSLGQSAVCTITNNDIALQLIVIKHVINDNGGTAVASDFTLDSGGANDSPDNFPGAEGLGTTVTLDAGAYNVSETEPAGYSDSYSTDCSGTITVGETKTCTITNDDNAPSLTLVKSVTNDDGGTALTSAWTLTATGPTGFSGTGPTVNNGASFEAGTYDLSESGPAGYIASSWVCVGGNQTDSDTVDIGLGENVTCTITNDDQAPTLKLVKLVTIDNGGTAVVDDWTLSADANSPNDSRNFNNLGGSGVFETVFANVGYDLSESNVTGYSAGSWSCNGGSLVGSTVTLGLNEDVTCTITNDDIAPTLTLVKVVEGGDGVPADWTLTAAGPTGFSGTGPTVNNGASFEAGTYDLSESGPTNYTASDWVCVGGSQTDGDTVEIGLADDVTCTITNTRGSGNITVIKNIDGNNDGDLEDDDVDQANVEGWTWDISGGEQNISMGESRTLITDNYTITEDERTDYAFVSWSCDNDTNGTTNNISLALNNNEEITCEFINTPLTDVHGRKWNDLDGNSERNGEEEFLSNWRIFIDENDNQILDGEEQSTLTDDNGWYVFHNLSPGTYDICEVLQSGWIQTFPTGGSCHAVTVPENSEEDQLQNEILGVPYDFGNQQQNPILTITKSNNAGGNKNPGDGVQFTLVVTALNSSINNVFVYDLPAGGFNYRSGSCMADSTVRGALSCAPTYASPGVWDLGNMVAGEVVTLTYWADISGDQAPGLYKDLAWAKGLSAAEETVMANNDTGYFVGTDVNVVKEQQSGENYNVESEQTVIGQVLGASTSLPATGANSAWLILAVILLGTGLNSLAFGLFLRRKNA